MNSSKKVDDYVTNHVIDRRYKDVDLRDLSDEEIEDHAQEQLERMSEDEMYDLLEDFIYDERISALAKARIFKIDTEVEING